MIKDGIVRSVCGICFTACGILVHVEDGKVTRIEGDPDSPVNKGVLCAKGLASLEYLYHPDRLKHPLKRVGERGQGKWQQISWDEALNIIASRLTKAKNNYGAESVVLMAGAAKGFQDTWLERFAYAFGTPNVVGVGHVCHLPRMLASRITHGFMPIPDYQYPPACIVVWASNMSETRIPEYEKTVEALNKGAKLIVIDPRNIELAKRADIWVQLRPGSDLDQVQT